MDANKNAKNKRSYRTIYSLRIKEELHDKGFDPSVEVDNLLKPGFKCWKFRRSSLFDLALDEIMEGGRDHG